MPASSIFDFIVYTSFVSFSSLAASSKVLSEYESENGRGLLLLCNEI